MARKPKSTAGVAEQHNATAGGVVTSTELEKVRQQPEINAAVTALQPYSAAVLGLVNTLTVTNPMERHVMADVLRQIKTAMETVDAKFDPITKPMWAAWRAATAWRGEVRGPLEDAERIAKDKLGDYELAIVAAESRRVRAQQMAAIAERQAAQAAAPPPPPGPGTLGGTGGVNLGPPLPPGVTLAFGGVYAHVVQPPTTWEPTPTMVAAPPPLQGVSTTTQWTVEPTDEPAAVAFLIQSGLYQLGPFLRLDVSALKIAVRADTQDAANMRALLAQVPGLRVEETATTRARGY